MTDAAIIDGILAREGSEYTDKPKDRGGPTKFGVTLTTLAGWRKTLVTPVDVEHLSIEEARAIYQHRYIDEPGFAAVTDDRLRALLVDWGVNSGPANAIIGLQRCLGVAADGIFGSATLAALTTVSADKLYYRVAGQRIRFLGRFITAHPEQAVFAAGLFNRCADFVEA